MLGLIGALALALVYLLLQVRRERRRMAAIRESEARFRELAENIQEGIWLLDALTFRLLYVSNAYGRIVGRSAKDLIGSQVQEGIVHADDHARVLAGYAEARDAFVRRAHQEISLEYRIVRPDGEIRWVRDRGHLVRDRSGQPLHIAGITDDITERRATEEALRESQRAMTTLLSNLPGMAYRCRNDPKWTMEFISDGCLDLTGYEVDELRMNRKVAYADLILPEDRDTVWHTVQRNLDQDAPFELTYRIRTASGEIKWVWEMGRGIMNADGQLLALEGFIADDSARRRAEQALRESEQRYRTLVERSPIPILIHTEEQFVFANPAAADALGAAHPVELEGRSIWDVVHPGSQRAVRERINRVYSGAGSVPLIEERFCRVDGGIIDVEVTGCSVEYGGKPASQVVFTDITRRKRIEYERAKLETQLRQSQKMEAVGQLAGGVAHDFNNILTAIIGHLGLAREAFTEVAPPNHRGFGGLKEVERAAERATALTRQLLTFSRKDVAQPTVLDVNAVLSEMSGMLRRLISENIELTMNLAPQLQRVRADASQLEQVVMNLVVNARDAMPLGGRIVLETHNVVLDDAYVAIQPEGRVGPHVLISVSDNGSGMDPAIRDRVFEPFFTTKEVGKGSGLGLAMVHGIVRQCGGHVVVYSEPNLGSTFRVFLPATSEGAALAAETAGGEDGVAQHEGKTVLVCEDDPAVRRLTTQILNDAGFVVLDACDGAQALQVARDHSGRIDLLLTDVIMPEMNGRELANRLVEEVPDLRVLFISGYTSDVIAHHGVLSANIAILEKPFSRKALLSRVCDVLDGAPPSAAT